MLFGLRRRLNTEYFRLRTSHLLPKHAAKTDSRSNFGLVSQICHEDVALYVVALHTFSQVLPPRTVEVVGDRLTADDEALLRRHCPSIGIHPLHSVDTTGFPRGGCWERFLTILDRSRDRYTVQLDADTVTLSQLDFVADCIENNRSFTLGTDLGAADCSVDEAAQLAKRLVSENSFDSNHIQVRAELLLPQVCDPQARYIRGNAAFAGFAVGRHDRTQARDFSDRMANAMGSQKWREWGSEQVASNFAIANSADAAVLPLASYCCYWPGVECGQLAFAHFMGTHRFHGGNYLRSARDALRRIS